MNSRVAQIHPGQGGERRRLACFVVLRKPKGPRKPRSPAGRRRSRSRLARIQWSQARGAGCMDALLCALSGLRHYSRRGSCSSPSLIRRPLDQIETIQGPRACSELKYARAGPQNSKSPGAIRDTGWDCRSGAPMSGRPEIFRRRRDHEGRKAPGRWSHWRRQADDQIGAAYVDWVRSDRQPVAKHFALIGFKGAPIRELRLMRAGARRDLPVEHLSRVCLTNRLKWLRERTPEFQTNALPKCTAASDIN